MKKTYSLLASLWLFLAITPILAQNAPIKWGEIPTEDLKMTRYEADTSARAVVLAHYGTLEFNFLAQDGDPYFELKIHKRIKILHPSAFEEGDISIPFYSKNKFEKVSKLKAQLFTPDGKSFPVAKKDIFVEKINDNVSATKFTFPNMVKGAVLEYKYSFSSKDLIELEDWYFQENIPVRWSELSMEIPSFYKYIFLNQGRAMDISEQDNYSTSITLPKLVYSPTMKQYEQRGTQYVETMMNTYRFVQKDVPALQEETYITTMENYIAKIKFQLNSTALPDAPVQSFLSNWRALAERLLKEDFFGQQFQQKGKHKRLWAAAKPIIEQGNTALEKVTLAYNFINNNIQWNKRYSYSVTANTLDECFAKKLATSGELNLMLLALLQEADIPAAPILVSTRANGKMQTLYPIVSQFNHTMVLVTIESQNILLDAGDCFRPIGYPRVSALNYQAWLVNAQQPEWINLQAPKAVEKTLANFTLDKAGTLKGSIAVGTEGYDAVKDRSAFVGIPNAQKIKDNWTTLFPEMSITKIECKNTAVSEKSFKTMLECTIPNHAQVMDDFIYCSPAVYNCFKENPFKLEERAYPVEIPYPFSQQFVLNLTLPEGYTIEDLPESARVVLPNKGGSFLYMVKQSGQQLQIISKIKVSQLQFSPEEYQTIKTFFDLIIEKNEAQIVLQKSQP